MTPAYYNEFEPFAADWLHNLARKGLIADGTIDRRSIADVSPDDVSGFRRVHFFAGIGGWDSALQLAGWPADREVWTGSCPCQPFSSAGKRKGESDERHLWPEMRRLVAECLPSTILGEQVASRDGREWLARVRTDLEALGYAVGDADLCAAGVGAPHIRQRLYWVAYGNGQRFSRRPQPDGVAIESEQQSPRRPDAGGRGDPSRLEHAPSDGRIAWGPEPVGRGITSGRRDGRIPDPYRKHNRLGDAGTPRLPIPESAELPGSRRRQEGRATEQPGRTPDPWADAQLVPCTDGKTRRVGSAVQPLAYGIPRDMGRGQPELRRMAKRASGNRVGRLRGYGNAIVPQVAAVFIRAFTEATS